MTDPIAVRRAQPDGRSDRLALAGRSLPGRGAVHLSGWAVWLARLAGWRRLVVAIGLGGLATLALPPVGAVPVLLVAFPALLWMLDGARGRWAAFWTGWGFGFGFFLFSLYWIAFALTVDLARFFWMIPLAAAGLPAFLGVFTGAVTMATWLLPLRGLGRALAFAALWALAEWLRGHVLTGFPWNLLGYGWVDWTAVLQSASVVGIYGLSLLTVAAAVLPAAAIDPQRATWSRRGLAALGTGIVLFAAIAGAGMVRLAGADGATVPGVRLRLVQPDIAQTARWDRSRYAEHVRQQMHMSVEPGAAPPTVVIWAESAVPYLLNLDAEARQALGLVVPQGGVLITGAPRATPLGAPEEQFWNSLYVLDPAGDILASYDKAHLVPFGEYVPFRAVLPIDRVVPSRVDFSAGPGPRTLTVPGVPPFSPLICYEAIFPGAVVDPAPPPGAPRPAWLLNLTNDAWYGQTAGPHQHFAIAQTRAVEEGLPLVRVAGTGISGVVDAYGRVTAALGLGERGVIDASLPVALEQPTIYARWRDGPFWLLGCALAVLAIFFRRESAKRIAY